MRIVGGTFRGRELQGPSDQTIRPTSDRVRESLFNILLHGSNALELEGCRVLDLFAGTGALGLEALSRGAGFVLFVEDDATARGIIRENVERFSATGTTKIFRRDATHLGRAGNISPFDLVFLDPPYGRGLGERALTAARDGGWLAPDATAVWEEAADAAVTMPEGFTLRDERPYGKAVIRFLQRNN